MAEVVKDFSDGFSLYEQVLFQRGRVIVDGELNEIGRLERVSRYRNHVVDEFVDMTSYSRQKMAVPTLKNITILTGDQGGVDDNDIKITPATNGRIPLVSAWGYVFRMSQDVILTTTPNSTELNQFQQIYLVIREVEIGAGAESAIKVDDIGETARRVKLEVEWRISPVNVDESSAEVHPPEPWNAFGSRQFLVATVHRTNNEAQVRREELILHYRNPGEITRAADRTLPGPVRLRSSNHADGSVARAYINNAGELVIDKLACIIGLSRTTSNDNDQFTTVLISGTFNLQDGESLAVVMPTDSNLQTTGEYTAVEDTPGANQLQIVQVRMDQVGEQDGPIAELMSQNLDNLYVICTKASALEEMSGVTAHVDIVFADGKRLTRQRVNLANGAPSRHEIRWSQGNKWHDFLPPSDLEGEPTADSDAEPWVRTYMPARQYSIKEIDAHVLRSVNPLSLPGTGDKIYYRRHTANQAVIRFQGDANLFTGEIVTINARYVPAPDPINRGEWVADDDDSASLIRYHGFNESESADVGAMFSAHAFRAADQPGTWDSDAWHNGDYAEAYHHKLSVSGSQGLGSDTTLALIAGYRRVAFNTVDQPVRSGGVAAAENVRTNAYACNQVTAYGLIACTGSGGCTLEDGSFNFDDIFFVDEGPGDSTNEAYAIMTLQAAADNSNYVPQVSVVHKGGDAVNYSLEPINIVARILTSNTFQVIAYQAETGTDYSRIMAAVQLHYAVTVHGGWNP